MISIEKILTPDNFRQWLQRQPENARIGVSTTPSSCPIATFLQTEAYFIDPFVTGERIVDKSLETNPHRYEHETPAWVSKFICTLDTGTSLGEEIRAKDALRVLNKVAPEPGTKQSVMSRIMRTIDIRKG